MHNIRIKLGILALGIAIKVGAKEYLAYQKDIIRSLVDNCTTVLKMPRQTGKTWCAAVVACAYLIMGIDVMVAYPTLIQGHKLLLSRIAETLKGCGISLVKFNQHGIELANGAKVHIVTTNETAHSNEGYTVGCLIVDEAHHCSTEKFASMFPSLKVYAEKGLHTIILCGIRGARDSIIEVAYRDRDFTLCHILPDEILKVYPAYGISLAEFKKALSDEEYAKQVLCEYSVGIKQIFHNLKADKPAYLERQAYTDVVGVDVGQTKDATIVTWLRYYPNSDIPHLEIMDTLRLTDKYTIQGEKIKQYLIDNYLTNATIGVEVNGVGRGLYDILSHREINNTIVLNVSGFVCTARSKSSIIKYLQWIDRAFKLHCTNNKMYQSIESLREDKTNEAKMKYQHSDYLSSLIVAAAMVGYG